MMKITSQTGMLLMRTLTGRMRRALAHTPCQTRTWRLLMLRLVRHMPPFQYDWQFALYLTNPSYCWDRQLWQN